MIKLRRGDLNQILLIILGLVATALFSVFLYRELFPEYRVYQDNYVALEEFRSSYTHQPPPAFKPGVKQIVFEKEDKGPPDIDRCISCHVAMEFPHFSPTKIAYDINGNMLFDEQGNPKQVPNGDYIWHKLDEKIAALKAAGELRAADRLAALKVAEVGDHQYDVTMALRAHPLMGRETRPFEFHPIAEYGCTSCHNGNGRGLTVKKAHGPVFDGDYETEFTGPPRIFVESDPENDPKFSRVFNGLPGHDLLFQTTPIYVGALIQSKCMQCHQSSASTLSSASKTVGMVTDNHQMKVERLQNALNQEEENLITLLKTRQLIEEKGVAGTIAVLDERINDYSLQANERQKIHFRINFLRMLVGGDDGLRPQNAQPAKDVVLQNLDRQIAELLGSGALAEKLREDLSGKNLNDGELVDQFIVSNSQDPEAQGTLFKKYRELSKEQASFNRIRESQASLSRIARQDTLLKTDVDALTKNFARGQQLYISQACYACHKIAGFARGGVGPELTFEGKTAYPWYIKQKIVWPQWDLKNSTMPNYRLDHVELEDLVTFILGQQGGNKAISDSLYKAVIKDWESGKKTAFEEAVTPLQTQDVNFGMTVFATEGCAACHRLKGFESNVGFKIEKEKPDFKTLRQQQLWFQTIIPEMATGTQIVQALEKYGPEIDEKLADDVRSGTILESIAKTHPDTIESFYSNFRFASRAKNKYFQDLAQAETDPLKKAEIFKQHQAWKDRVHRVLMMYIQEYGLGRLVGPRPNWSGVYRSDQWLMEHFRNPSAHIARSIMPIFPFDDSKFYALTHMLDILGIRNRDAVREIWKQEGFSPDLAFQIHCSQCHGEFLGGNGPVAEWIYPIPKNLRNADFLRNMTKERIVNSIVHGVAGTPMPPWGEVGRDKPTADGIPVLTRQEAERLADWMLQALPGGTIIRSSGDVPKWQYQPQNVIDELQREGSQIKSEQKVEVDKLHSYFPAIPDYLVSLEPVPIPHLKVEDLFDKTDNPPGSPERYAYHIKKSYYTEENLKQGQLFFEMNCAVCHGKEGDGSGVRGSVMQDAKPRMLTNLDWLDSRDDLRLLRSIKFGVPGTSMSPWGDQTTSKQRLQLVMYIRSLTEEQSKRTLLYRTLYQTFNPLLSAVEQERYTGYPQIVKLQQALNEVQKNLDQFNASNAEKAVDAYKQKLDLTALLDIQKSRDQLLLDLHKTILEERKLYELMGLSLISRQASDKTFNHYIQLLKLNSDRIIFKEGKLEWNFGEISEVDQLGSKLIEEFDAHISGLTKQIQVEEGKIASVARNQKLAALKAELIGYKNVKIELLSGLKEASQLRLKQESLIKSLNDVKI